jgi:hypothetical protein
MNNKHKICHEFIKASSKQIPSYAWDCTTPIVVAYKGNVQHFGTGTLFCVADYYFLVTAAHVFKQANEYDLSLGIGGSEDEYFISLKGNSLVSSEGQYGSNGDPLDVGIHHLASDAVTRLRKEKTFIHYDDIDVGKQSPTAVYTLFGFPGVWSSLSTSDKEKVKYKALQYTTYQYNRSTSLLSEYQERLHLLLDGQLDQSFDIDASPIQRANLVGNPTPITKDLGGISGCSVWRIGDFNIPADRWDLEKSKLVAVQTGAYYGPKAIKATRWIAVNTLIYHAFPELRPVMQLIYE